VRHGRYVIFQMAVVAQAVLSMMRSLAPDRERATLAVVAAALVLAIPSACELHCRPDPESGTGHTSVHADVDSLRLMWRRVNFNRLDQSAHNIFCYVDQ